MVETSATPASIAARFSVTEQAVKWLLDNHGGGDGDGETAELLKRLYKALVFGASASPTSSPWEDTLVYDNPGESMHVAVFGTNYQNAVKCLDGKGLYGRVFSDNEARWAGTGATYDKSLATEIFGQSDTGYIDRIRSQNLRSLAQAVFKTSANITSGRTIIDRIAEVQTDVDELANNAQEAIGDLESNQNTFKTSTNDAIGGILSRLTSIEHRLTNGGL